MTERIGPYALKITDNEGDSVTFTQHTTNVLMTTSAAHGEVLIDPADEAALIKFLCEKNQ